MSILQRTLCMNGVQLGRTNLKSVCYLHDNYLKENVVRLHVCAISLLQASHVRYWALGAALPLTRGGIP